MSRALSWKVAGGAAGVMFLWAICFPLIRVGLSSAPPLLFAFLRAAVAGVALLLWARLTGRPGIPNRRAWLAVTGVGLTATTLGFVGMFYGGGLVSPGLATVVANTQPLIAALLAAAVLGERLTRGQQGGLITGFVGIVLIGLPYWRASPTFMHGVLFILLGALGIAISNVILKRIAGQIDVVNAMGWQLLLGSLPLAFLAAWLEPMDAIGWTIPFALNLLAISLLGTALAFVGWFALLERAPLTQLNTWTFLTPIFGLALGWIFFDEDIATWALVGVGMSLGGIFWISRADRTGRSVASLKEGSP